ncbi:MAG: tetratricopeptide repeat protein [Pirellulales bacterium]|nr:tetratricopeptide repeat protein [Pirellulales bacterium]
MSVQRSFCVVLVVVAQLASPALAAESYEQLVERYGDSFNRGDFKSAEDAARKILAANERAQPPDRVEVARAIILVGAAVGAQYRYADALTLYDRAEPMLRESDPSQAELLAELLDRRGIAYQRTDRLADAQQALERAIAIRTRLHGADSPELVDALENLGDLFDDIGKAKESEELFLRATRIERAAHGDSLLLANVQMDLANLYKELGRNREAESLVKQALAIRETKLGGNDAAVGHCLSALASIYASEGRYAEAEQLHKKGNAIDLKYYGPQHPEYAKGVGNLAYMYAEQGRYAEAEPLMRQALAIFEKSVGPDSAIVAIALSHLAIVLIDQGREVEALPLMQRVLAIRERVYGPDHPAVAMSLNNLANRHTLDRKYEEAEKLYRRALAIFEKALGKEHPRAWEIVNNLGYLAFLQERYDQADELWTSVLAWREKTLSADDPETGRSYYNIGKLRAAQDRHAEAIDSFDRAIEIWERVGMPAHARADAHGRRANSLWALGQRNEAVADLRRAMDLAEEQRGQSSGGEQDRATAFAELRDAFTLMVAWQAELNDPNEAFTAMERSRARSLLDEFNAGDADLHAGRSAAERTQLKQRENELNARIRSLESQVAAASDENRAKLEADLTQAREELYAFYRELRATSEVYRSLLATGGSRPRIGQIQRRVVGADGLMLSYMIGDEATFVLALDGTKAKISKLDITTEDAKALGIEAGPLTADKLHTLLIGEKNDGLVSQLAKPSTALSALPKLAALWNTLIPTEAREAILSGNLQRLVVIPDGALAFLPFETLVVEPGPQPRYLLDVGPPIVYGPSASVLYSLDSRQPAAGGVVLSLGDPVYNQTPRDPQLAQTPRNSTIDRAARFGMKLAPLPNSGKESRWVCDLFAKAGAEAVSLTGNRATEAELRRRAEACRILHLACHGVSDQEYSNLFGALLVSPGPTAASDPADDGQITLPEIYELNLKNCDLAILSACQTNFGPQQQGEGVWALSRGFLVAGARRVVASNWIVDDAAAASLISYFCGGCAKPNDAGAIDYAAALHAAKLWVRQQSQWQSPFYWGSFELVGMP